MGRLNLLFASTVATGVGLYFLRQWAQGCVCSCANRLEGKTVLITGGSDGIGKYTALDMASRGAKVIIAARDVDKLKRAAEDIRKQTGNANVIVKHLNLASLASVRTLAADIKSSEKSLHILVNNAGVMALPRQQTEDGFEWQFGVNHLGHFLLTNLLLDHLKSSAPSRVVVVSSRAHTRASLDFSDLMSQKSYDPWTAYGRSKLANVLFAKELSKRLQGTQVSVFSLHPGVIPTGLFQHANVFVRIAMETVLPYILKTSRQGAQTTICCSVCPGLEEHSGAYFSDCKPTEPSADAQDAVAAQLLWSESERLVGMAPSN